MRRDRLEMDQNVFIVQIVVDPVVYHGNHSSTVYGLGRDGIVYYFSVAAQGWEPLPRKIVNADQSR